MSCLAIRVKHIWVKIQHPPKNQESLVLVFSTLSQKLFWYPKEKEKQAESYQINK